MQSYSSAHCSTPSLHPLLSASCLSVFSLHVCHRPSVLKGERGEGEGGRGAKLYDLEKARPSINHSILSGSIGVRTGPPCVRLPKVGMQTFINIPQIAFRDHTNPINFLGVPDLKSKICCFIEVNPQIYKFLWFSSLLFVNQQIFHQRMKHPFSKVQSLVGHFISKNSYNSAEGSFGEKLERSESRS